MMKKREKDSSQRIQALNKRVVDISAQKMSSHTFELNVLCKDLDWRELNSWQRETVDYRHIPVPAFVRRSHINLQELRSKLLSKSVRLKNAIVYCATVTPNYQSSCVLVQDSIYCYSGGYVAIGSIWHHSTVDEFHFLDLTQTLPVNTDQWSCVPSQANYQTEPSMGSSIALISNTSFVLDGGYSGGNMITNVTKTYDKQNNQWKTIPSRCDSEANIYSGTAVSVPKQGLVYYWGGLYDNYTGDPVMNTTILNIQLMTWSVNSAALPPNAFSRNGHTATLDTDGINIVYIGGMIGSPGQGNISSMKDVLFYNTLDGSWALNQVNTSLNISDRYHHTATALPFSSKILIYGGAMRFSRRAAVAVPDYLYLFDTKSLEYSKIQDQGLYFSGGPRYGHEAILYKNTLIVLFGVNQKGILTNDVRFLSLNNNYTWMDSFNSTDEKLTTPAIIGLSIGLFFAMILIVSVVVFVYKKRRSKRRNSLHLSKDLPTLYQEYTCTPNNQNDSVTLHEKPDEATHESIIAQSPSATDNATITIIKPFTTVS
ncbi:hypothetical protein G6F52_007576 [Rhizopus delemar]|nr:hypothetical protein G6F52_007576 [Rhizopus delemar]